MKLILTTLLAFTVSACIAQPKLPDTVHFKLTSQQVIALSNKLDSVTMLLQSSNYPAGMVNPFVNRLQLVLEPMFVEIRRQIIQPVKPNKK